jgi:hypothetical protein
MGTLIDASPATRTTRSSNSATATAQLCQLSSTRSETGSGARLSCALIRGSETGSTCQMLSVKRRTASYPIDRKMLGLRYFKQLGRDEAAMAIRIAQEAGTKRCFRALKPVKAVLVTMPEADADSFAFASCQNHVIQSVEPSLPDTTPAAPARTASWLPTRQRLVTRCTRT